MDGKTKKILLTVAGVFVVIIILLFIVSSCSNKKFKFEKFQDDMVKAAKSYYKKNEDSLPKEDGETKTITISELINSGNLKDPAVTYKKSGISCDGSVTVLNNDGFYVYTPSATCGKDFRTTLLIDKIQEDSLVETGVGLHKVGEELIYKGEINNNFVKINGNDKLFRIIKVNADGSFRLIEVKGLDNEVWDDRYNPTRSDSTGINDYMANDLNSRIKDRLASYYNDSSVWTDDIKAYVLTQKLCIGKRSESDTTKDGSTECSVLLDNQKLGLLNVYEFLQTSLDENCNSTEAVACQNYNWLADNSFKRLWTITGDADNTHKVYWKSSSISKTNASASKIIYSVINIPKTVIATKGNGTEGDPYIIK